MKKIGKIFIMVLACVVAFLLLAVGGLNLLKFAIYADYYGAKVDVCVNPGLNDDFICQGIANVDDSDCFLVSGYMTDGSASRIYVTNTKNEFYYVTLSENRRSFDGHVGGVAAGKDTVYLANDGKIYTFSLAAVLSAENGDEIEIGNGVDVISAASFVYTDDEYLYVGEFHNGGAYNIVGHEAETADGTYYAYCGKYDLNNLTAPVKVYSIRNKVQGICFTPDGKVVMSTSYGLTDTVYYVYNEKDAVKSGTTVEGAPLYYLDKPIREMKGPAMGEDLDYYNGRVVTLTESASNKYVFGKFFFANKIVGVEF